MFILAALSTNIETKLIPLYSKRCFSVNNFLYQQQRPSSKKFNIQVKQQTPDEVLAKFKQGRFTSLITRDPFTPNFRKQFNIEQDYALVYTSKNESYHIIFSTLVIVTSVALVAKIFWDLFGTNHSFESVAMQVSVLCYVCVAHYASKRILPLSVYRIFHNAKTNAFVLVGMKRSLVGFEKVMFNSQQIKYIRMEQGKSSSSELARLRAYFEGNFSIKDRPFIIELNNFTSPNVIDAMLGSKEKAQEIIRLEESLRNKN